MDNANEHEAQEGFELRQAEKIKHAEIRLEEHDRACVQCAGKSGNAGRCRRAVVLLRAIEFGN